MGRTLATYTQLVHEEYASWSKFRRALRKEDQEIFDALFRAAKYHVASGAYASRTSPFEAMLMAMLLEAMKSVALLQKRVARLESERAEPTPSKDAPACPAGR